MAIKFSTENQTFRKIMANGLQYIVPRFQRDYAWGAEQWEDLWEDLEVTDEGDKHYMGYLVFQSDNEKVFSVIDGQQRLTTVSIIIIAALYILNDLIEREIDVKDNQFRLDQFRTNFIGFTDSVSLVTKSKLTLNRNNNSFYKNFICPLQELPLRGIPKSSKQLAEAVKYFKGQILAVVTPDDGASLALFIEDLLDKLLFTTISVSSDLNAYRVFETLNARGVQLSVPDLLKNYLFSLIDKEKKIEDDELTSIEEQWEFIVKQLGPVDFTKYVTAHWNSSHPSSSRGQLFKKIKGEINNRELAFNYLKSLRETVGIYAALHNSDDEFWVADGYRSARPSVRLLNLFNIKQPHAMLLSAYKKLDADKFCRLLKSVETISVRYNIIGARQANIQERAYNSVAVNIFNGHLSNNNSINTALRSIYPDDEEFKEDFRLKTMRTLQTPKKARYLLAQLEVKINPENSIDPTLLTLEHILPENPSGEWRSDFGHDCDEFIDRLGNMTLVSKDLNKALNRKTFNEKKGILKSNSLSLSQKVLEFETWNSDSVNTRQAWMAHFAVQRWNIQFN